MAYYLKKHFKLIKQYYIIIRRFLDKDQVPISSVNQLQYTPNKSCMKSLNNMDMFGNCLFAVLQKPAGHDQTPLSPFAISCTICLSCFPNMSWNKLPYGVS